MFVTVFSRHSWRQSWWNTPLFFSHIMLIPVISVRCWEKSSWVRLEERGGGEPCSTSRWFPCGSNPLILTDKDLINTRLCNYSLIKVIWPLVWMSSQGTSRCSFSRLNLTLHPPNRLSHHVLMKASSELLVLFWQLICYSLGTPKHHRAPRGTVNRPRIDTVLFKLHRVWIFLFYRKKKMA